MDEYMEKLYREATLRDKSTFYRSEEYIELCQQQYHLLYELYLTYGLEIFSLFEEYLETVSREVSLERRNAFELGYRAGKQEAKKTL